MRAIMQGLTDAEFERLYGTEEQCLAAWVKVRQEAGMPCLRCGNPKSCVCGERVGCTRGDMRWSITSGTVMADTKLPLTAWFRGMHLMTSTKQCISAVELDGSVAKFPAECGRGMIPSGQRIDLSRLVLGVPSGPWNRGRR
jgi:hypothetical protein